MTRLAHLVARVSWPAEPTSGVIRRIERLGKRPSRSADGRRGAKRKSEPTIVGRSERDTYGNMRLVLEHFWRSQMSVLESAKSEKQSEALGLFLRAMENVRTSIIEAAHAYRAAIVAGVDLSAHVTPALAARLEVVARGLLIEKIQAKALLIPPRVLDVLEKLPPERQRELAEGGVEVWRDGKQRKLKVEEVTWVEARTAFDLAAGRPRLLTVEEQRERSEPQRPKSDRIEQLRFTPAEYEELQRAAAKDGSSVKTYLKRQLYLTGILPGIKDRERVA